MSVSASNALPGVVLTDAHREYLVQQGISAAWITGDGAQLLRSSRNVDDLPEELRWLPDPRGILFGWAAADGSTVWQVRPDDPPRDADSGEPRKYLFPKDSTVRYGILRAVARVPGKTRKTWIIEGTKQAHAAAAATDDVTIIAIPGCWGWSHGGSKSVPSELLPIIAGSAVTIFLDADAATKQHVYDAGVALRDAVAGAVNVVRFARVPGGGSTGLDDYLSIFDEADRPQMIEQLVADSQSHRKPAPRRPRNDSAFSDSPDNLYDEESGRLNVEVAAEFLLHKTPMALTLGGDLAVYRDGAFRLDPEVYNSVVGRLLGNRYSKGAAGNVEGRLRGLLAERDLRLPEEPLTPWLNVENGMLDLDTLTLHDHDPKYLSMVQLPVTWNPAAVCPRYDEWLTAAIGAEQIPALEEATSQFLDPAHIPSKAPFLYGESRSGKGTFLRLIAQMAGRTMVSGVTLHALARDGFAGANLYGKLVNVAGDLSDSHIADLSLFKMMTGQDPVHVNPKYGKQFTFTNRAMFAFSANTPPTVGEKSKAYTARVVPVLFNNSFLGTEDPAVEAGLVAELPGILVRWVRARREHKARGKWLAVPRNVMSDFASRSDRVAQFLRDCCRIGVTVSPSGPSPILKPGEYSAGPATLGELHKAFDDWRTLTQGNGMARNTFGRRLETQPGVLNTIRRGAARVRCFNIEIRQRDEWFDELGDDDDTPESGTTGGSPVPPAPTPAPPTPEPATEPTPENPAAVHLPALTQNLAGHPALHRIGDTTAELLLTSAHWCDPTARPGDIRPLDRTVRHWWNRVPATITLDQVAASMSMPAERVRAYLRAVHDPLAAAGILLLERRMAVPQTGEDAVPDRVSSIIGEFVSKPDKAKLKAQAAEAAKAVTAAKSALKKATARKSPDPIAVATAEEVLAAAEKRAQTTQLINADINRLPPALTAYTVLALPAQLHATGSPEEASA